MRVTAQAPAKVNLHLGVGDAREDGFHELVTVYHAVDLYDVVTVTDADALAVTVEGEGSASLPTDDDNLAVAAARLLADHLGRPDADEPAITIRLRKEIPVAAGLAGGSADAAATLVACNKLWGADLERPELGRLAAELGSDVPFSLAGGTALGRGRGELLSPVLARGTFHWVLAIATTGLSTPRVFRRLDERRADGSAPPAIPGPDAVLAALAVGDRTALAAAMANDLHPIALGMNDGLHATLRAGEDLGALASMVSGSGPTVALLAEDADAASHLAAELAAAGVCRRVRTAVGPVPGARVIAEDRP